MNVDIIKESFNDYENMNKYDFEELTGNYLDKYAPLSKEEEKLLAKIYTEIVKNISSQKIKTSDEHL